MRKWLVDARVRYALSAVAILALLGCAIWMMRTPDRGEILPAAGGDPREPESKVAPELRERIDKWIAANGLNRFGDPPGTRYTGGTPLFDPKSGTYKDRYAYILERHQVLELKQVK